MLPSAEPTRALFVPRETATTVCLLKNNQKRRRRKREKGKEIGVCLATAVLPLSGALVEDATLANIQSAASILSVAKGGQRSVPGTRTSGVGFH